MIEPLFTEAAARFDAGLVLPTSEQSMLALSKGPDGGAPRVVGPAGDVFRRVSNKQLVLAEAPRFGLDVPRQCVVAGPHDSLREVLESVPYPVAIKSAASVAGGQRSQTAYATDAHELEAILRGLPAHRFPLLVQERIAGPGEGVFVLPEGYAGYVRAVVEDRRGRKAWVQPVWAQPGE